MKISKLIKVLVGIATALVAVIPFLVAPLAMMVVVLIPGFPFLDSQSGLSPEFMVRMFTLSFVVFMPMMTCVGFAQLALQVFYIVHLIKEARLTDVSRVLFALGVFFMPYLLMPIYFFLYVWGEAGQESNPSPPQAVSNSAP